MKGFVLMLKDGNYMFEFGMKLSINRIFYRPDVLSDLKPVNAPPLPPQISAQLQNQIILIFPLHFMSIPNLSSLDYLSPVLGSIMSRYSLISWAQNDLTGYILSFPPSVGVWKKSHGAWPQIPNPNNQ